MADILKNDVQTYVRALISTAFESNDSKEKTPLDNLKPNRAELRNGQGRPTCDRSFMEELPEARGNRDEL